MVPYCNGNLSIRSISLNLNLLEPGLNLVLSKNSLWSHSSLQTEVVTTFLTFSPVFDRDGTIIAEPALEIGGSGFLNGSTEKGLEAETSHAAVMPQKGLVGHELANRTWVLF